MTIINGKNVIVNKPIHEVYSFLIDLRHFKQLLPEDKISDWEASSDSCSFKIQNVATIGLYLESKIENAEIKLASTEKTPFPFSLTINLFAQGDSCKVEQICHAEVNPFLKMMVEKPLNALFDHIADRLVIALG